jgi:hypothetical protein
MDAKNASANAASVLLAHPARHPTFQAGETLSPTLPLGAGSPEIR